MSIEILKGGRAPRLDARPLPHRIGLVALATDHSIEPDFARVLAPAGVAVHVNRIPYANPVTPVTLAAMEPGLTAAAELILPGEALDAVVFGCTSASVVIGDANVERAVQAAKPGVPVVTPIAAAIAGLRAMSARRISVLTPYSVETSTPMAAHFEAQGFTVDRFTCLELEDDREMARIALDEIVEFARTAVAPGSEALFVSCTAVRAAGIIDRLEAATGVPVLSSNHAAAWNVLRLCRIAGGGPGHLMTLPMGAP